MNRNSVVKKLAIYGVIITVAAYFMPKEQDWTPYFSNEYDTPFGNEILYENLSPIFPSGKIESNLSSLYELKDSFLNRKANYIMIQEQLDMDSLDLDVLIKFVENGNDVFISALDFPYQLLDTLKYELHSDWTSISSIIPGREESDTIFHDFYENLFTNDSSYIFNTEYSLSYFEPMDSIIRNTGIGWAKHDSMAILVMDTIGKGRIFLHSNPFCFSNYYMVKDHQRTYIEKAFSYLPDRNTIWDEYYNPYNSLNKNNDILKVIRAKPPLTWAFYLAVTGIILYLLFKSKRKQRVIPVLDTYPNESLDLIKTIGELYFNTANNKKASTKKVNHFFIFLNRTIGLDRSAGKEEMKKLIASKTTLSGEDISQMLNLIENLEVQESVSDGQLLALQKYILILRREIQK